jgi:hypothetical protein
MHNFNQKNRKENIYFDYPNTLNDEIKTFILLLSCMTSSYAQSNKLKIILDESGETYVKGLRGQFGTLSDMNQELVLIVKR